MPEVGGDHAAAGDVHDRGDGDAPVVAGNRLLVRLAELVHAEDRVLLPRVEIEVATTASRASGRRCPSTGRPRARAGGGRSWSGWPTGSRARRPAGTAPGSTGQPSRPSAVIRPSRYVVSRLNAPVFSLMEPNLGGHAVTRDSRVPLAEPVEELAGAAEHQRGRVGVVGRQRAVGEQVLVAGVGEQLAPARGRPSRPARGRRRGRPRARRTGPCPCRGSAPGRPSGHGPNAHSPVIGMHASYSSAPRAPGLVCASRCALAPPRRSRRRPGPAGSPATASLARASIVSSPMPADERDAVLDRGRAARRRTGRACARCARPRAVPRRTRGPRRSAPARGGTARPRPSVLSLPVGV